MQNNTINYMGFTFTTSLPVNSVMELEADVNNIVSVKSITGTQDKFKALSHVDWYYEYSDDNSVWRRGAATNNFLKYLGKTVPGYSGIVATYKLLWDYFYQGRHKYPNDPDVEFLTQQQYDDTVAIRLGVFKQRMVEAGLSDELYQAGCEYYLNCHYLKNKLTRYLEIKAVTGLSNDDSVLGLFNKAIKLKGNIRTAVNTWRPMPGKTHYVLNKTALPAEVDQDLYDLIDLIRTYNLDKTGDYFRHRLHFTTEGLDLTKVQWGHFADEDAKQRYINGKTWYALVHLPVVIGV